MTLTKAVMDCSTGELTIVELSAVELEELETQAAARDADLSDIRQQRNQLLANCDWTQGADAPLTEAQIVSWATYRQELRDFPDGKSKVSEFPTESEFGQIIWPTPPS